MKKLLRNKKGFTLMEMLIVVAIIGILVSVSIPVFSGQLEKAKKATDDANVRAAKAAGAAAYLTENVTGTKFYNAETGKLVNTKPLAGTAYGKQDANKTKVIKVTIGTGPNAGTVTTTWE